MPSGMMRWTLLPIKAKDYFFTLIICILFAKLIFYTIFAKTNSNDDVKLSLIERLNVELIKAEDLNN